MYSRRWLSAPPTNSTNWLSRPPVSIRLAPDEIGASVRRLVKGQELISAVAVEGQRMVTAAPFERGVQCLVMNLSV